MAYQELINILDGAEAMVVNLRKQLKQPEKSSGVAN